MVEKIKKQNEKADDLMEQQDDMIANYKVTILYITYTQQVHSIYASSFEHLSNP